MDRQMLNRLQFEVGSFQYQHLLDVVNLVELQSLDELNLDEGLTCQVAVHLLHQLVEQVDVEVRHQLRMDYFQDAAPVLMALALLEFRQLEQQNLFHVQLVAQYCFRQSRALAQP
jgi:hypothetical protein